MSLKVMQNLCSSLAVVLVVVDWKMQIDVSSTIFVDVVPGWFSTVVYKSCRVQMRVQCT